MISTVSRVYSHRVVFPKAAQLKRLFSDAKPSQSLFTMSPLTSGISLIGITGLLGVFMYYQDDALPQNPPKEEQK